MLPDPVERPLLKPAELVGVLPFGRSAIYAAIERGDIPTIRYGSRVYVVNAELQRQWGLRSGSTPDSSAGVPPPLAAALAFLAETTHDVALAASHPLTRQVIYDQACGHRGAALEVVRKLLPAS